MSRQNPEFPKPPARLHTVNVLVATVAGIISIIGGIASLNTNLFQREAPAGILEGVVQDERLAKPLRLATVEVSDSEGEVMSTLTTDENGSYRSKNFKPGRYQVKAAAPLHKSQTKEVVIRAKTTATVDFSLVPGLSEIELPSVPTVPTVPRFTLQETPKIPEYIPPAYPKYAPPLPPDETRAQSEPSRTELLVKTGAVLLEEWLMKDKTRKRTQAP